MKYSDLEPGIYTLRVVAANLKPDKEFIKRRFEITNDTQRCTLHLINDGITVTGDSATVEFTGRGPIEEYYCRTNRDDYYLCEYASSMSLSTHSTLEYTH